MSENKLVGDGMSCLKVRYLSDDDYFNGFFTFWIRESMKNLQVLVLADGEIRLNDGGGTLFRKISSPV